MGYLFLSWLRLLVAYFASGFEFRVWGFVGDFGLCLDFDFVVACLVCVGLVVGVCCIDIRVVCFGVVWLLLIVLGITTRHIHCLLVWWFDFACEVV